MNVGSRLIPLLLGVTNQDVRNWADTTLWVAVAVIIVAAVAIAFVVGDEGWRDRHAHRRCGRPTAAFASRRRA